jgi:ATP-dependent exoDNAse (exonuclease V) alpha subunit
MATNPKMAAIVAAARERLAVRALAEASKATHISPSVPTNDSQAESVADKIAINDSQAAKSGNLPTMQWGQTSKDTQVIAQVWAQAWAHTNKSTIINASKVPLLLSALPENAGAKDSAADSMSFNPEQMAAIELGLQGKSFCLIGAAGTGKTTVTQALITRIQRAAHMLPLAQETKHLDKGAPGIVICGFTNKAVNNIRKRLPPHLQKHCITIHKFIEYAPAYYDVEDITSGKMTTTMRFEPSRNSMNKLPHISTIIFEEASMIGTDLFDQVMDALPLSARTQFIFLGDLNQLPPVFGPSILGFKLAELRTIELTHVYRQALLSPIISIATAIRTNNQEKKTFVSDGVAWHERENMTVPAKLSAPITIDRGEHGKLTIHPWKKRVEWDNAINMMKTFLPKSIESGTYDPEQDMILCPFNKSFGTIELNKIIADYLGKKRGEIVHEVIARYEKSYFAVGDRVLVDRHEAIITKVFPTPGYYGKSTQIASKTLNRWGYDPESGQPAASTLTADEILNALDSLAGADDNAKNLASHTITVYIPDLDKTEVLNTAGEINNMLFGYALTVHKSQGSEWQRVFLFLHNSHATMLSRELLYTAVTRAKHELYVICEGDIGTHTNSLSRGAARPVIPGTTLTEKIAFFAGKAKERGRIADVDTYDME